MRRFRGKIIITFSGLAEKGKKIKYAAVEVFPQSPGVSQAWSSKTTGATWSWEGRLPGPPTPHLLPPRPERLCSFPFSKLAYTLLEKIQIDVRTRHPPPRYSSRFWKAQHTHDWMCKAGQPETSQLPCVHLASAMKGLDQPPTRSPLGANSLTSSPKCRAPCIMGTRASFPS